MTVGRMQSWGSLIAAATLVCVSLFSSNNALAEDRFPTDAIDAYFDVELQGAAVVTGLGAGSGYIAGSLFANGSDLAVGAAIPVVGVGVIQLALGVVLLVRTGPQVAELKRKYRKDPALYQADELPRIEGVNFWFDVYKAVEIGLIGVGAAGIVVGALDDRDMMLGAGIGLSAQGVVMLAIDLIAEANADAYTEKIKALQYLPSVQPVPQGLVVSVGSSF